MRARGRRDPARPKHGSRIPTVVIVPTYNEKGNLEKVHQRIFQAVPDCSLLIVDDASPDGTGDIADALARRDRRVEVLHRPGKQGLGSAYVQGMRHALARGHRILVAMDADLSHDPGNLPRMLQELHGRDLVIGSRYVKDGGMVNWGVGRFLISRIANGYCRFLLGLPQEDCTGGYKCYRAELLERIGLEKVFAAGYSFQVEILYRAVRAGAKVKEIPIVFVNRHEGKSKLNLRELLGFAWTVLKLKGLSLLGKV